MASGFGSNASSQAAEAAKRASVSSRCGSCCTRQATSMPKPPLASTTPRRALMKWGVPVVTSLSFALSFTCTPTTRPESSRKKRVSIMFVFMGTPMPSSFSIRGITMAEPCPTLGWMVRSVLWPP